MNKNTYWAQEQDHSELLNSLDEKIKTYQDDLRATGLLGVYERAFRTYYGGRVNGSGRLAGSLFESSSLLPGGKQGEKTRLKANHYRNLLRHLHQLTTSQKPAIGTRAANSDYRSQSQTVLADGLLDYYWREKNLGNIIKDAAELSLAVYGEAFIHNPWDPNGGEVYAVGPYGLPVFEGEQDYDILTPIDAIRDPSLKDFKKSSWCILRLQKSRWELAAQYSIYAEDIIASPGSDESSDDWPTFQLRGGRDPKNDDQVSQYILYHKKTKALPEGRLVIFLKNLVLFDGPMPYRNLPLRRVCSERLYNTIYGYTVAWDLLGIQEGIDELHTTLMSNNKTFGIQSLHIKDTDSIQVSSLGGGMKLFKSENPPTPIQLTKSAPESYDYLDKLEQTSELLSGISSTVRGNPEASLKSGTALALVVSQSVQFAAALEDAINRVVEELGTDLINNIKDFSQTERVANIVGKSKRAFAKTFSSEDLSEINRVIVEQVNPLSKTVAGRAEIANNLLQQGMIKNPEDYIMVLSTGNLNPVMEGRQLESLTIQAENEELRDGKDVMAIITENHKLHIEHHKDVISDPDSKRDPELVQRVLNHIQEHIDLAKSMDPALQAILGYTPVPGAMTPPSDPMQNQAPAVEQSQDVQPAQMPGLPPGSPPEAEAAYDKLPIM